MAEFKKKKELRSAGVMFEAASGKSLKIGLSFNHGDFYVSKKDVADLLAGHKKQITIVELVEIVDLSKPQGED